MAAGVTVIAAAPGGGNGSADSSTRATAAPFVVWHAEGVSRERLLVEVARACELGDDILVLRADPVGWDPAAGVVPLPEDWARAFAEHGFARDLDDLSDDEVPGAVRYRRVQGSLADLAGAYERRHSVVAQTSHARRALLIERAEALARAEHNERGLRRELDAQRDAALALEAEARDLSERNQWLAAQVQALEAWRAAFTATPAWRLASALQSARAAAAPGGSRRDAFLTAALAAPETVRARGLAAAAAALTDSLKAPAHGPLEIRPVEVHPEPGPRTVAVDVVVCVHNALDHAKACLESVVESGMPDRLILVDDGSGQETRAYLQEAARTTGALLIRNESALGYTRAANLGLTAGTSPFVCLLNSDTVVAPGWLDRLVACAEAHPSAGLVVRFRTRHRGRASRRSSRRATGRRIRCRRA
jgi:hypothetical protein